MIDALAWLGLAVADAESANAFYEPLLGAPRRVDGELRYPAGTDELRLRPPGATPPGGAHVHYAFSTGSDGYEAYRAAMADRVPVEEYDLHAYRSAYGFDPDDHCVEFANRDGDGKAISGIFEIVLEVTDLDEAADWYGRLDSTVMDRGDERRRIRLDLGPVELELWEQQRGIADAKPGTHVEIGFAVADVAKVADRLEPGSRRVTSPDAGTRIVDPDGHGLTLLDVDGRK